MKPGLKVEQALLACFDRPERRYAIVHVGGSNGKGSVCAMLSAMARAMGLKTGLYTSPHLARFNERFQVDGQPISDHELFPLVEDIENAASDVAERLGKEPTFFECTTAIAFAWFARAMVDVAVVEVGMGGRLDATNVVDPLISVITGVSLEHTEYLGADLPSIAREKGGIVKPGRPLVCGETDPGALDVFKNICRALNSPIILPSETVSIRRKSASLAGGQKLALATESTSYGTVTLPLQGRHQIGNLAVAVAAMECMTERVDLGVAGASAIGRGIAATVWPARFQVFESDPPVILDGAHNPGAAKVLAATVADTLGDRPLAIIFGMCDDKDLTGFLKAFPGQGRPLWTVPIDNPRTRSTRELADAARAQGWDAVESTLAAAQNEARGWAKRNDGAVLITGSLYLAGEVLRVTGKPWPYA